MHTKDYRAAIANRLKACRKEKRMSLDSVAGATGVSKAMLGQVERRESVPTISTLWKIAGGLGVSFSSFFGEEAAPHSSESLFPNDPDMDVALVFPFNPATRMEVFDVTLRNHHRQHSPAHQVGVVEHIVVRHGCLEVVYEKTARRLKEGQSIRFYADIPHEYGAVTETVRFQDIICYT